MSFRLLLVCLVLMSCSGRPLTPNEVAFSDSLLGDQLDVTRVRLIDGAPTRAVTFRRKPRPRVACRELIVPPPTTEIVTAKPAAVALYNRVLFDRDWFLDDYLPSYPDEINLVATMLLAHELTHIWQWQNRDRTGYTPLKAALEHRWGRFGTDPYLFDLDNDQSFLEFGFEQQGSIVEEYVCCRALAPQAPRTQRLHTLISAEMPLSPLPQSRIHDVVLPWDGVDLAQICQ